MSKLLIFLGMTFGGWFGWWLGERVGFTTAFVASGIGSMASVYAGWRLAQDYF